MTTNTLTTLRQVLSDVDHLPWDHALFISKDKADWSESMPCMVLDPDDVDGDEEDPELAIKNNMKYAFEIAIVQDVISNAKAQLDNKELDLSTKLVALKYYFDHDAFMEI
ncbi:DUF7716 domain-containing protein [Saccharospirillum salsuginis]|uniref:DUF7716 domain-containing protein n=1 Tax=Saccharospirillum salsuginis TaxID=418750 RepID=A0A918KIX2_9GAMM|nr:hypothetical protein [Saccharospirillum salsuginis]GGX64972.1 hypothetical protein GCM10007392_36040 [Saccharospirillum salsuginis]